MRQSLGARIEGMNSIQDQWSDLTVDFAGIDPHDLLIDWRWLVGLKAMPIAVAASGDMFVTDDDGRVLLLDVGAGQLIHVADNLKHFETLKTSPGSADKWLASALVHDLRAQGKPLQQHQCYSYVVPPVLGGAVELSNFEPCDLEVHFSILGQIHRQVAELPEGTPIKGVKVSRPGA
jgi:hypothetical protein